jgi:hypothetical protein
MIVRKLSDQQPEDAPTVRNHNQVRYAGSLSHIKEQEESSRLANGS